MCVFFFRYIVEDAARLANGETVPTVPTPQPSIMVNEIV